MEGGKFAFRRTIRNAALLGIASLLLNLFSQQLNPDVSLPLGNLFLFTSAGVYGPLGGMVSAFISEVPRLILSTGGAIPILKNIFLVSVLAISSTSFPRTPNQIPFILFWILSAAAVAPFNTTRSVSTDVLLFTYDLMLLSLAKMLLMSTTCCSWLTSRLHYLSVQLILPECLFITFSLVCGLLITLPLNGTYGYEIFSAVGGNWSLWFAAAAACIPILLGWTLTRILFAEYGPEIQALLRTTEQHSEFTGILGGPLARQKKSSASEITREDEEHLRSQTEESIDESAGRLIVSKDGIATYLNSRFRLISGLKSQDGVGTNIRTSAMHPKVLEAVSTLIQDASAPGIHALEVRLEEGTSGQSRFLDIQLSPTVNPDTKENDHYLIKIKDITDRRTVESHLLQAKKVEALGAMVNGVAHSFNDALTAITGQASLALMTRDAETTQRSLEQILDASKQAGQLVQQLLDFALDTSHSRKKEDLVEVINSRSELIYRCVGDSFDLVLEKHVDSLPVRCNTNLLLQALTNLILNAMESYEGGTGKILVEIDKEEIPPELAHFQPTLRPGNFARIKVKDSGSGMPAEVLSKAFDPLYSTKHGIGHTGLGLSIVFAVIRAHDGFLTAESHVGTGTTIALYLPLVSETEEPAAGNENTPAPLPAKLAGKKILVIEDDPSVLGILELLFGALQCEILSFSNGIDALRDMASLTFDAFLIDLVLPSMSGIEIAMKIRETKGSAIPGVIMSGYAIDPKVRELNLGILRKPFDISDLESAIAKVLGS